jgi:TonB family protein
MRSLLGVGLLALGCAGSNSSSHSGSSSTSSTAKLGPQGLSQQEIQEVVQAKMQVIEGCAVIAEATSGSLVVSFQVAPSGAVDQVEIIDSSVNNAALEACLVRTFQKLEFPSADVATRSEFPFTLRSKQ